MYKVGEKPGKGSYKCKNKNCDQVAILDNTDTLPPCPKCSETEYTLQTS